MNLLPMRYHIGLLGFISLVLIMVPSAWASEYSQENQDFGQLRTDISVAQNGIITENPRSKADRLFQQGSQQFQRSQFEESLQSWEKALIAYRQIGNRSEEGRTLNNIGTVYRNFGQYQQALSYYEEALAISREIGQQSIESNILNNIGAVYGLIYQYDQALNYYNDALSVSQEIDYRAGESNAINNFGSVYQLLGQYEQSIDYYQQALALNREIGDRLKERATLSNLGNIYQIIGNYEQAIIYYKQALSVAQEIGDLSGEEIALENLGKSYQLLGQYKESLDYYQQTLEVSREIGNRLAEEETLSNIGNIYQALGQYEQAVNYYQDALVLSQTIGSRLGEEIALSNLASLYQAQGQYEEAIDLYQQALSRGDLGSRRTGRETARIIVDNRDFFIDENVIDSEIAGNITISGSDLIILNSSSLNITENGGDIQVTAGNLALPGLRNTDEFFITGRGGLPLHPSASNLPNAVRQDLRLASNLLGNNPEVAYQEVVTLFTNEIGPDETQALLLTSLGILHKQDDEDDLAIIFLKASVNLRERIRGRLQGLPQQIQRSYIEKGSETYRRLAELLLSQGRIPEAQQVLDLLKLEELREFTNITRATWTDDGLEYTDSEQAVIDEYGSIITLGQRVYECRQTRCDNLPNLRSQQQALTQQYESQIPQLGASIRSNDLNDEAFQDPIRLSDDAYKLLQANPDAILIYPFVAEENLWLLWASIGGSVGSIKVEVSQSELSKVVQQFGEQLSSIGSLSELQASSKQLYDWLIKPLEEELQGNDVQQLIFVNDRITRYIPMAALYDGEQYLIERYTISNVIAPAITDTEERLTDIEEAEALGLGLTQAVSGFSSLPAVKQELDNIILTDATDPVGVYPGQILLDDDFTLEALQANVEFRRILHIATHAQFAPSRPEDSYIVMGSGQRMSVSDIEMMQESLRDLHLVVLSACQTALGGTATDGTEIAGISSYFLAANRAETVIASLWSVNDNSTSLLMQHFYELLASGELTKAEALRQAQLSLIYDEDTEARLEAVRGLAIIETTERRDVSTGLSTEFRHPYYWAPFILIGNGL